MKWKSSDFGGILLECGSGNIAVNGGAPLAELEKFYLPEGKPPAMMIATCEHHHRAWNVDRFCLKYHVPLVMPELAAEQINTEGIELQTIMVPETRCFLKLGVWIALIPVEYDSVEPFCLTVNDTETMVGIVPDGRIYPDLAKYLLDCDTVILGNRLPVPENAATALERRLRSVCNTQSELDEYFEGYSGEAAYI